MSPNVLLKNLEGGESYQIDVATSGADHSRWVLRVVEREMEVIGMKHCEHCGEEIKGSYLQINCEFFDEYMIEFDHGAFCC